MFLKTVKLKNNSITITGKKMNKQWEKLTPQEANRVFFFLQLQDRCKNTVIIPKQANMYLAG